MNFIIQICLLVLLPFLTFFQSYAYSNESNESWITYWLVANKHSENKDYMNAEQNYSLAISLFKGEEVPLFLYNERAVSLIKNANFDGALKDFSVVIENFEKNPAISNVRQALSALWGRISIYLAVGQEEDAIRDYDKISELDPDFPVVEFYEDILLIKNLNFVNDLEVKQTFIKTMIELGICEKTESISFTVSGMCIIKTTHAYAEAVRQSFCKKCTERNWKTTQKNAPVKNNSRKIIECQEWCDKVAISVGLGCAYCPTALAKSSCAAAVAVLREGCHWCCSEGNFYEKCLRPLKAFYPKDPVGITLICLIEI